LGDNSAPLQDAEVARSCWGAPSDWRSMKIRVLARKNKNGQQQFVVQVLNVRDEWARLREFYTLQDTAAYLRHLKKHDKVTDDDIEYSIT
jgi:hypothetical protein